MVGWVITASLDPLVGQAADHGELKSGDDLARVVTEQCRHCCIKQSAYPS